MSLKNLIIERGTDTQVAFTHPYLAANVINAWFYVRDKVDGSLYYGNKQSQYPAQWSIVDTSGTFALLKSDLEAIQAGLYVYDVKLETSSGATIVQRGALSLVGEVSTDVATDTPPTLEYHVDVNEKAALDGAASPSASNVFATMNDVQASDTFIEHSDTPASYTGQAGKVAKVNTGETAIEFGSETDPVFGASEAANFVAGDKSKLDGIEAGADVTDAANVQAAGAVMTADHTKAAHDALLIDAATLDGHDTPATGNAAASEVVLGNDTRLTDSRTPTAHASTHATAGGDPIAAADIGAAPALTVATRDTILATTPTAGLTALATDTGRFYVADGTNWLETAIKLTANPVAPNIGVEQDSSRQGYGKDYVSNKSLNYVTLGAGANDTKGAMRLLNGTFQIYANGAWNDVVINFRLREDSAGAYEFEHNPIGFSWWYEIMSGNSDKIGIDGKPIVQQYTTSMGAYQPDLQIDGGTF